MELSLVKQAIADDKARITGSYKRYPVRFLFMELNNNTQDEILDIVKSGNGSLLELSDHIMKKDDGWLTKSRFMTIIENHVSQEKDTYVIGFSEMIRFYSVKEIESTVLSLFDIENKDTMNPKSASRRIYLICFSMIDSVFKVLQNCFARKSLINPFINSDYETSSQYRKICFVSDGYSNNIKQNKITTTVEWIGLWRHSQLLDFTKPIWCCSASLFEWHKKASPDNAFQIEIVKDTKQYLKSAFNIDINFEYREEEENLWLELLSDFEKDMSMKSIKDVVERRTGGGAVKPQLIAVTLLNPEGQYVRWLVQNYVRNYMVDSYLNRVLQYSGNCSKKELLLNIWLQGYRISNPSMLQERLDIIKELNKYAGIYIPEEDIRKEIIEGVAQSLDIPIETTEARYGIEFCKICESHGIVNEDMIERVSSYYTRIFKPALTGLSSVEREFLINLGACGLIGKNELQIAYPEMYSYAFGGGEKLVKGHNELKTYISEYRRSKIANEDSEYIKKYYMDGKSNEEKLYELYYSLDKQDSLIDKRLDKETDVYVIDGVGAEYVPVIVDLLSKCGYEVESCEYASAHLPTITEVNKWYLSKLPIKSWIKEFDNDVIHGEYYHSIVNIRKALEYLSRIIEQIVSEADGKRIIITADHGATARARWVETKKKYDYSASDHEGRCCKITNKSDYKSTEDYLVYQDEINPEILYLVSMNEVSLYNRPKYEDHGGATPEELIVPVIVAKPESKINKKKYKVFEEKLSVNGLDELVAFTIKPEPESLYIVEEDGAKHNLVSNGDRYQATLNSGRVQEITLMVDEVEYRFKTENTGKKNMEGDDGFDD